MGGLHEERFGGSGGVGEWRMRAWDGGVDTVSGDGSETGLVMKKKGEQKSTTCIGVSFTPDYRDKEESSNKYYIHQIYKYYIHHQTQIFLFCFEIVITKT